MTLLDLMHDTAHDLGIITNYINFLEKTIGNPSESQKRWMEGIRQAKKDIQTKLDNFYKSNKK